MMWLDGLMGFFSVMARGVINVLGGSRLNPDGIGSNGGSRLNPDG